MVHASKNICRYTHIHSYIYDHYYICAYIRDFLQKCTYVRVHVYVNRFACISFKLGLASADELFDFLLTVKARFFVFSDFCLRRIAVEVAFALSKVC